VLWDPRSHERLVETSWREAVVRDAIAGVVAEAESAFDAETLSWPAHPRDAEGADVGPWTAVYLGTAGVVWALDQLGSEGDWAAVAGALPESYRAAPDFGRQHPSLLVGESGVLLVEELVAGSTDRDHLAELVAANADAEERELMWGSPGTMLAADVLAARTGEQGWLDLWERSADRLVETWEEDGVWLQLLYGRERRIVGAVHGFAGNVFALAARRDVAARAVEAASRLALREDGLAQWPAVVEQPSASTEPVRTQFCHGAPGMVTTLGRLAADDDEWTALLAAGGELIWRAGPLAKGAGLCHGTAGNGYALLRLFERTGDERWLERARAFARHAAEQVAGARRREGRGRFSLWTGDLGTAVFLQACLETDPRIPFYERF
jgi:Lanthionine synthetase C-like protein